LLKFEHTGGVCRIVVDIRLLRGGRVADRIYPNAGGWPGDSVHVVVLDVVEEIENGTDAKIDIFSSIGVAHDVVVPTHRLTGGSANVIHNIRVLLQARCKRVVEVLK